MPSSVSPLASPCPAFSRYIPEDRSARRLKTWCSSLNAALKASGRDKCASCRYDGARGQSRHDVTKIFIAGSRQITQLPAEVRTRLDTMVTPLAIDRGYKVSTRASDGTILSDNERHLRRQAEWQRLVRASLRHVHVPEDLVESCQIQLTAGPLLPATERAERYRPKDERARFVHACLTFCRPVRGPLLVGDRRYQGFGLFLPDHS